MSNGKRNFARSVSGRSAGDKDGEFATLDSRTLDDELTLHVSRLVALIAER
jgi:hypothetical protein